MEVYMVKVKPLGDRVLVKTLEPEEVSKGGIILPESAKEKPQEAKVVAVGPGKIEDGKKVEMNVKVGDKVIFARYSGDDIKIDGDEYTIIEEEKILAVVE